MGIVNLPHGPWKSLLVGKYDERDVSLYQNPQKDILYVVVDRDEEGKAKGLVVTVYRSFYLERGDLKVLLNHISGSPVGVSKKWKGDQFQFLLLPAGIKYIGLDPQELKDTVDEMEVRLIRMEKNVVALASTLGMMLRPFSVVPKNIAALLFVEPSVIAGLAPVAERSGERTSESLFILGSLKTGGVATESPLNMRRTIIYGDRVGRKRAFQILLEEFLRTGVNALVVTQEPEKYRGLSRAAEATEMHKKLGIEPVGFSTKELKPLLDLAVLPPDSLVEVAGLKLDTETAAKTVAYLEKYRMEVEKTSEIVKRITETDVISLRAGRVLTALDLVAGSLFRKETYNQYISLAATGLGGAYILSLKNPWDHLSLLNYIYGIGEALKRRGKSEDARFMIFVENGERVFTKTENRTTKRLLEALETYREYGLGWVVEVEKSVLLNDMLIALTETNIGAVGENDVGVRTLVRRPYRVDLRPYLTSASIEGSPAPSVSSQPAPQPAHRLQTPVG